MNLHELYRQSIHTEYTVFYVIVISEALGLHDGVMTGGAFIHWPRISSIFLAAFRGTRFTLTASLFAEKYCSDDQEIKLVHT